MEITQRLPPLTPNQLTTTTQEADPFDLISGCTSAEDLIKNNRLKLAIVGAQKSGKSLLASTVPGSTMHYDFDDRRESLRRRITERSDLRVKTLIDKNQSSPTAVKELENDLALFKVQKQGGKPIPRNYILDSMTYLKKWIENELIKQDPTIGRAIAKLTNKGTLKIPAGWDAINGVRSYMEYFITEFSQLGNLICVFHERDEKDRDKSTEKVAAYTGKLTVEPQYLATVLSVFNEVWRVSINYEDKFVVQTKPDFLFGASTTLEVDKEEPADIAVILQKHMDAVSKKA